MTLGPSRSSILFCRSSNRVTLGTALTAALTKGGNLGRARGRQPQATSAGPHVTSGLLNKLQIESKKMPSNSQKHPGLEGRTSAFFAGHPCARWVFSSFTQVITRNPGRGVNCGPPNKYACILT